MGMANTIFLDTNVKLSPEQAEKAAAIVGASIRKHEPYSVERDWFVDAINTLIPELRLSKLMLEYYEVEPDWRYDGVLHVPEEDDSPIRGFTLDRMLHDLASLLPVGSFIHLRDDISGDEFKYVLVANDGESRVRTDVPEMIWPELPVPEKKDNQHEQG